MIIANAHLGKINMSIAELLGTNYALISPGQGSQVVGIGHELWQTSPAAKSALDEANEVLGFDLQSLMFEGPAETLNDTYNAQPAILAMSIAR